MRRVVLLGTLVRSMALVGVATAAPPDGAPGKSKHEQIVEYWTPARIAHAVPREFVLDLPVGAPAPRKGPGGGGGGNGNGGGNGGGGGGGGVTGAPWTGAGLVRATVGKVLRAMDGVDYVCSGAVVHDSSAATSLVPTAGHCVYDETGLAFATHWMFVPDYEHGGTIVTNPDGTHSFTCDTTPYGCWTADALVTTTAWATGGASPSGFNDDYAFAVMGPGGKTGESLQLDATVGTQAIAFNQSHPASVYAFGYPQASPDTGGSLIYCSGTDTADSRGGSTDFGLNCDMTGGSSGGPWFVGFDPATGAGQLTSVNSFKYTRGPATKYMFGPYCDGYTNKTYGVAQAVSSNTLVAPERTGRHDSPGGASSREQE